MAAPVFGRPEAAAAAKLTVVTSGSPAAVERCRPLFDAIGQVTFNLGDNPVAANVVKISGNLLIASVIEGLGEAMALVRKHGIDPAQYLNILTSTLFSAPVYKIYGGLIVEEKYQPAGFKVELGLKDVRSVLAAAEVKSVPMSVGSVVKDRFLSAIARGGANLDWSALAKVIAEDAGLKS